LVRLFGEVQQPDDRVFACPSDLHLLNRSEIVLFQPPI
jgi:hypothetical protein